MDSPDPHATLRAVAETILPACDHSPGAADVGAERFMLEHLELLGEEAVGGAIMALDGYALSIGGAPFASLSLDDRSTVLRALADAEIQDLRDLATLLFVLPLAAFYGSSPGWEQTGYPGPSRGYSLTAY